MSGGLIKEKDHGPQHYRTKRLERKSSRPGLQKSKSGGFTQNDRRSPGLDPPVIRRGNGMEGREIVLEGKDHTEMLPIFRSLVIRSGAKKGDRLIWAGCSGPCYSMATFFSYGLRDLGLNLFFASDGNIDHLWRLEFRKELGMMATRRESPLKAKIIVLMSGLLQSPFEPVLTLTREGLQDDGIIIGETVVRGLFENAKWHEKIPFRFLFEFSMERPTALKLKDVPPS
jgi:hypothetical protein